jgi:ABC-type oligopeptide transport system ATPase subunit
MTYRWYSLGIPVSSTNKTDRHDITEILLKVALNTTKENKNKDKNKQQTNNKQTTLPLMICYFKMKNKNTKPSSKVQSKYYRVKLDTPNTCKINHSPVRHFNEKVRESNTDHFPVRHFNEKVRGLN